MIAVTGSRMRSFFARVMPRRLSSMSRSVSRWMRVVRSHVSRRREPRVKQDERDGRQDGKKCAEDAKSEADQSECHEENFF